jgi:hypothetical protein
VNPTCGEEQGREWRGKSWTSMWTEAAFEEDIAIKKWAFIVEDTVVDKVVDAILYDLGWKFIQSLLSTMPQVNHR